MIGRSVHVQDSVSGADYVALPGDLGRLGHRWIVAQCRSTGQGITDDFKGRVKRAYPVRNVRIQDMHTGDIYTARSALDTRDRTDLAVYELVVEHGMTCTMGKIIGFLER